MTIQEFKTKAIKDLSNSPTPALDIEVLLSFSTGFSKTQILLNRNTTLSPAQLNWLEEAVTKRNTGLPVAYITGQKEFYGYNFIVTPSVLIPKPDTEILVERAIEIIIEKIDARPNSILTICDMCTGSGCIAIAVLKTLIEEYHIPYEKMPKFTLVDISDSALEIAKQNSEKLLPSKYLSNIRFIRSNLFDSVPLRFDVILTNPPYIPTSMVDELLLDGRSEPRLALDGDITLFGEKSGTNDGLEIIRNLLPQLKEHLCPKGTGLMETGEYNAEAAAKLAEDEGLKTKIRKDLEGQLRIVEMF